MMIWKSYVGSTDFVGVTGLRKKAIERVKVIIRNRYYDLKKDKVPRIE
ncbi:MAG TPA: hypothetical protein VEG39_09930 [Clostridia bacterium]|nr:hypothetical protein [Clostridia bacterium]